MPTIIFASNNKNKAREIRNILPPGLELITLKEAGIEIDIAEPYNSLQENAKEKARVIYELTGNNCFSEDSGLHVISLNGEPGVKSARYSGANATDDRNIDLLLKNMEGKENRTAVFRTVICLRHLEEYFYFEGECRGEIMKEKKGSHGFGYDPIFTPDGANKTFGEMDSEEKNIYSHRKKATLKFIAFLKQQYGEN